MATFLWLMLNPLGVIVWGLGCTVALVVVLVMIEAVSAAVSR